MPKYVMHVIPYPGAKADPVFSFDAAHGADAYTKMMRWARYHSFTRDDVHIEPATPEQEGWDTHNEYIPAG